MSNIDLGNNPVGVPPTATEAEQIRNVLELDDPQGLQDLVNSQPFCAKKMAAWSSGGSPPLRGFLFGDSLCSGFERGPKMALAGYIGQNVYNTSGTVTTFTLPNSARFNMFGKGLSLDYVTKTSTYSATPQDYLIKCDATSGSFTINLPDATTNSFSGANSCLGRIYVIKKIDSSGNTVTVDGFNSQTIDGATTKVLSSQWETLRIQSDGANWMVV